MDKLVFKKIKFYNNPYPLLVDDYDCKQFMGFQRLNPFLSISLNGFSIKITVFLLEVTQPKRVTDL